MKPGQLWDRHTVPRQETSAPGGRLWAAGWKATCNQDAGAPDVGGAQLAGSAEIATWKSMPSSSRPRGCQQPLVRAGPQPSTGPLFRLFLSLAGRCNFNIERFRIVSSSGPISPVRDVAWFRGVLAAPAGFSEGQGQAPMSPWG